MKCFFCDRQTYLFLLRNKFGVEILACKRHRDWATKNGWREISQWQYDFERNIRSLILKFTRIFNRE